MNSREKHLFRHKGLLIIFSVTLISVMGVTSIAPAFPKIAEKFSLSVQAVSMLVMVFTFPGIILAPLMGIMADRFGRKRILVPSLLLFGIMGTMCSFTDDFTVLLVFRFFQGIGAASLGSLNLTIIGDIFSGNDRVKAMGYNAFVLGLGTMTYPSVGGAIALLGWNYPFLLSVLAIPVGLMVMSSLDTPPINNLQIMKHYLRDAFRSIANLRIVSLYLATLSIFILLYGVLITYFPFYMNVTFKADSFTIGIFLTAGSAATSFAAFNLGRLTHIFSSRKLILCAFIIFAVAIVLAFHTKRIYFFIIPALLYGFANGISIPSIQTQLASGVELEQRGAVMSLNSMVLRIGQTVGPGMTAIMYGFLGMEGVFYGAAAFAVLSFLILLFLIRD